MRGLLDAERVPYTQNTRELETARDEWLLSHQQRYKGNSGAFVTEHAELPSTSTLSKQAESQFGDDWVPLCSVGWMGWKEKAFARPYKREMIVMAEVSAYFHLSCDVRINTCGFFLFDSLTQRYTRGSSI